MHACVCVWVGVGVGVRTCLLCTQLCKCAFMCIMQSFSTTSVIRLNLRMPPDQDSTEVRRNAEAAFEKDLAERSLNVCVHVATYHSLHYVHVPICRCMYGN